MAKYTLEEILLNDPLGVIGEVKVKNSVVSEKDRLIASFEEINEFVRKNDKLPQKSMDINERKLYSRLQNLKNDKLKKETLLEYDIHNLLKDEKLQKIKSIDDILENDFLGILDDEDEDIFDIKHIPKERKEAAFIAKRKKCENFEVYEPLFKECQRDLRSGKRKLARFNEKHLVDKTFFVIKGLMGYLVKRNVRKGRFNKVDGRIYCVFENGTESNMLFRSLGKELYKNGYLITRLDEKVLEELSQIKDDDKTTGYIYVLKSLSSDPKIKEIDNLYKIGYSTLPVKERVKNAKNEPTYLMEDVEIVAEYQCYNLNPQKFEQLLHNFFGKVCLNIDIYDKNGHRYIPREWFSVSLSTIDEAIKYILSGEIIKYEYDTKIDKIVLK